MTAPTPSALALADKLEREKKNWNVSPALAQLINEAAIVLRATAELQLERDNARDVLTAAEQLHRDDLRELWAKNDALAEQVKVLREALRDTTIVEVENLGGPDYWLCQLCGSESRKAKSDIPHGDNCVLSTLPSPLSSGPQSEDNQ